MTHQLKTIREALERGLRRNNYNNISIKDDIREALDALRAMPTPESETLDNHIALIQYQQKRIDELEARLQPTPESAEPVANLDMSKLPVIGDKNAAQGIPSIYPPKPESAEPVAWMWPAPWDTKFPLHISTDKSIAEEECSDPTKIIPLHTHPPKPEQPRVVLTDEFVKDTLIAISTYEGEGGRRFFLKGWNGDAQEKWMEAVKWTQSFYASDNRYLAPAPFPVDEVMEVVKKWTQDRISTHVWESTFSDLRARLTNALTMKP